MIDLPVRSAHPDAVRLPAAGRRLPARLRKRPVLVVPPAPEAERRH
ncbi:hypothetical protein QOZ88_01490 [Blastococcus sp. BMG 814]|uniref:Uncharacterized protein n=1 Tax=Blastococcus carthaginiensis TaxID=3050034 RepID=A0ABT9I6W7_9ACTN|nr:hypothetical protein [Blastococcus carthaginiensis]MDP5181298.1 hypothetical protein [Blastococcus carthaginiensis]